MQAGDSFKIDAKSEAFAVQRQVSAYLGNEGNLDQFPLFKRSLPEPVIHEYIPMNVSNPSPVISVGEVRVIGLSASSVMQIGTNRIMELESRIEQVRQFVYSPKVKKSSRRE